MSETTTTTPIAAKWLPRGAVAIAILGVIMGLLALAAPLGVWVNAWDFRTGFAILGVVYNSALWVVMVGLVLGLFIIAVTLKGRTNLRPWLGWVASGVLVAYIAWSVPHAYRPAPDANIPPIHDIATDPENPLAFDAVLPLRAEAPNTVEYGGSEDMTPEKLAALQRDAYPHIRPQYYQESPDVVFEQALSVARDMGWDIVTADPESGRIEATDTTFWFRFKDDVVIAVTDTEQGTELQARSLSRVGRSDVGKNAARLAAFFQRMTADSDCCQLLSASGSVG